MLARPLVCFRGSLPGKNSHVNRHVYLRLHLHIYVTLSSCTLKLVCYLKRSSQLPGWCRDPRTRELGKEKATMGVGEVILCTLLPRAASGLSCIAARVSCRVRQALTTSAVKTQLTHMFLRFLLYSLVIFLFNQGFG